MKLFFIRLFNKIDRFFLRIVNPEKAKKLDEIDQALLENLKKMASVKWRTNHGTEKWTTSSKGLVTSQKSHKADWI